MDQYEVQLDRLDDVGKNRLPAIAESIANAHAGLKEATSWISRTFDTRGNASSDGPWNAEQPHLFYLFWRPGNECYYAMDFMRQIFEDNRENVDLAAQAIREIANRYRQAEADGVRRFDG